MSDKNGFNRFDFKNRSEARLYIDVLNHTAMTPRAKNLSPIVRSFTGLSKSLRAAGRTIFTLLQIYIIDITVSQTYTYKVKQNQSKRVLTSHGLDLTLNKTLITGKADRIRRNSPHVQHYHSRNSKA